MTKKIIHVIGKGESKEFFKHDGNITIGVNNVNKWIKTDHVVIVDPVILDNEEIDINFLNTLKNSTAQFWSQIEENKNYVKKFNLIELSRGRGNCEDFDTEKFVYSITSPFVAVHLAYKLGATDIVMWGVDFNNHPSFMNQKERALKDFDNLKNALNSRSVNFYVGNEISLFSSILPVFQ